jgi:hypothetical protein
MNMSRLIGAMFIFICAIFTAPSVSAAIFEFLFTGQYTLVDPSGNVLDHQPISSTFTYNSGLGAGSSAAGLTIDNFDTFGNTATIYDISLELVTGNLVLGNMLADWGVNFGVPLSTVWDASGMINAIVYGLHEGDVISGTDLIRGGDVIFDVGSAIPASDGLSFGGSILNQGPAPLAVTTWNTTTVCTPGVDCFGNAYSGGAPFTDDSIAGSPMIDGPFVGLSVNFDIGSGHSLTVLSISNVPVPAAVWLFGSGLIGLIGISRRKKAT